MIAPSTFLAAALILTATQSVAAYDVRREGDLVVLSNGESIEAAISPQHGGELTSLRVLYGGDWRELIYRARDYTRQTGWRGKAQLLWPATGRSVSSHGGRDSYDLAGISYPMPQHGFARQAAWQVIGTRVTDNDALVTLNLGDTPDSRLLYPFGFIITVEYRLAAAYLEITYTVVAANDNEVAMPFSIGNHITLNLPLIEGSSAAETLFASNLERLFVTTETRVFEGETTQSPFSGPRRVGELPRRKAVSLGGANGVPMLVVTDPSGFALELSHRLQDDDAIDAIDFNLWADTMEGFFSPEPWVGTQNSLNTGFGLVKLLPGDRWQWRVTLKPSKGGI